jgi:oxygen-independent coproporphyrinogen-3 oxidase
MYEETMVTLARHGFEQYEVSNYAHPGRECRHNLGYWERQSYVSFGPSAHSFLNTGAEPYRWANVSNLSAWLDAVESGREPLVSRETITPGLAIEEIIYLGLRSRGIPLADLRAMAGIALTAAAAKEIEMMTGGGYALLDDERLRLTRKGYPFADRFAVRLIDAIERAIPDVMTKAPAMPTLTIVNPELR